MTLQAHAYEQMEQMSPSLLIFDCDGVLIDNEVISCQITSDELSRLGFEVSADIVATRFVGRPECEMIAEIEAEWGRPVPRDYAKAVQSRLFQAYADQIKIMPGVRDLLRQVHVDVCVASSSHPKKLEFALRSVGLYDLFAPNIVSASFVERGKPSPDVFIYAAGWMRVPVHCCLVIEDSVAGARAACAAGMRAFGFTGGAHCNLGHRNRLLEAGVEQVIADFQELKDVLPSIFVAPQQDS